MELGNVQRFEIVSRAFRFQGLDDGEAAWRRKLFSIFLEDLTNQVMRANGRTTPGRERFDTFRGNADCSAPIRWRDGGLRCDSTCERSSLRAARQRAQFDFGGFQPIVRDLREHTGFSPEPGHHGIASRKIHQRAQAQSASKRPLRSRESADSSSGRVIPRWTSGFAVLFSCSVIAFEDQQRRAQCNMPCEKAYQARREKAKTQRTGGTSPAPTKNERRAVGPFREAGAGQRTRSPLRR